MATRDFSSSHQLFDSELSSVRPCHVLLEPLPSGCEANGSSVDQSRQDEVFDGPGEANSDSGDSLFITQKSVPEAVRSRKRRCSRLRPDSKTQHENPAKQNAETSSSSSNSDEEPKTNRKKKKKILKVPKIRFSFLNKTSKMKPIITNAKHTKLQLYTMGGFFSSVHELWKSFELGSDLAESLPTVDMDGQTISPISEEDEETLEEEDLKVVERKHFVASLKASSSQPWSILNSSSNQRRRRISALNRSQIEQQRTVHKDSIKMTLKEMLSSDTESSDDGDALGRGLGTIRSSSPQEVSTTNIHTQTERPDTKSHLQKIKEQLLGNDSDTIKRDQEEQTAQIQLKMEDLCMDEQSQSESTACGFENQNTPQRDVNSGTLSSESKVKKRKKKDKRVKKGSQKPEGQHDVVPSGCMDITEEEMTLINEQNTHASNRKKKKKKKKSAHQEEDYDKREQSDEELEVDSVGSSKTGSDGKEKKKSDVGVACVKTSTACEHLTDDGSIKKKKKKKHLNSNVPQTSTEHHEHLENTEVSQESVESNFTKRKKKKNKKKKKSAEEEEVVQQEQSDEELAEDSVCSSKTRTDGKEKKKRNDAGVACVKTNTAAEPPTDDGNIKKKKKKKRLSSDVPQTSTEHHAYLENTEASQSMESKFTKKKKTSAFDIQIGEGDRIDLDISNDPATLETDADLTVKKKKKKKRGISETEYISHYAEEDKNIGNTQKEALDAEPKTKKKKMQGNSSKIIQENILAPVKYSVSVQKKKRKTSSSFLTADEEGKKGHTHEKHPPDVSIDTLAATSADVSLSLGESKDRSKKKKKRRSAGPECLERELEFKEPKETSEAVVKKKKKHKRNDSKLMSSMEMSESLADAEGSQTDEAVVLSKKKKKNTLKRRETIGQHDSLPANKPGNQTPKEKKKGNTDIKHLLKVKALTKTVTSKKRTEPAAVSSFNLTPSDKSFSKPETSSVRKNNNKRRLYNPNLDLFTDF